MYRVLITGDRHWDDYKAIRRILKALLKRHGLKLFVIEGGARGADRLAGEACRNLGIPFAEVPALWDFHGRAAGPIRNASMLNLDPDLVIAFHADLAHSKGTRNMVEQARKRGVPCKLYSGSN
jgi:hypothetical protein